VIANILIAPGAHKGKTYPLFEAKEVTFPEMAEEVGRVLGKPVRYQYTEVPALAKLAKEHGKEFGDFFWQHLTEIAIDHQNGVFAGTQRSGRDHRRQTTAHLARVH
jgi:NAD(P)H dehydrogenase (quinone)